MSCFLSLPPPHHHLFSSPPPHDFSRSPLALSHFVLWPPLISSHSFVYFSVCACSRVSLVGVCLCSDCSVWRVCVVLLNIACLWSAWCIVFFLWSLVCVALAWLYGSFVKLMLSKLAVVCRSVGSFCMECKIIIISCRWILFSISCPYSTFSLPLCVFLRFFTIKR